MKQPRTAFVRTLTLSATLVLAACGGGGNGGGSLVGVSPGGPSAPADQGRGALVVSPPPRSAAFSADAFKAILQLDSTGKALLDISGTPQCGIDVRRITYHTVGGRGEDTIASGALMLPTGDAAACSGARPIVLYGHGTTPRRDFDLAQMGDTTQPAAGEATAIAALFAAQGYIVVAPNYAGYAGSTLPYHPYLNGEQQGKDMADALTAARKALPALARYDSGTLYVTGYSQGGYTALAAQRELQAAGTKVTAAAALSAPAAISLLVDYTFSGWPAMGSTVFTPLLTTSWQREFGNVYSTPQELYEEPYANGIESLLPSTTPIGDLFAAGKLPPYALFPANASPGPLRPDLAIYYGAGNLVRQSALSTVAADIDAHPCAGNALPATAASLASADPLQCQPVSGLRQAARANDLRNWLPQRPLLMCGGAQDPTVNFVSTRATAGYFLARGMPASQLTVLDLEAPTGSGDPFAAFKVGFATAKAQTAQAAGGSQDNQDLAVSRAYHGTLVAPFCLAAARGFFQAVQAQGL